MLQGPLKKIGLSTILGLAVVLASPRAAHPCTVFCLVDHGKLLFAQNYDWTMGHGALIVNKKGLVKIALALQNPAKWTSRYGSVTLNQYGREFPCGGMNEAGLVVAPLWLNESRYPKADDRGVVNILEWIQYQLDTAATIKDVIASDKQIRIRALFGETVHYLVADRSGRCATIEFIDGKMLVHKDGQMPTRALANEAYRESVAELTKYKGFGGQLDLNGEALDERFVHAAQLVKSYDRATDPIDYLFGSLKKVAQGEFTKWSVVYDLHQREIHLRTFDIDARRVVHVGKLNFSSDKPVQILDINKDLSGDVTTMFAPYTRDANRTLIVKSAAGTHLMAAVPAQLLEVGVVHPERHKPVRPAEEVTRRPQRVE